jgi:hypothetical protein
LSDEHPKVRSQFPPPKKKPEGESSAKNFVPSTDPSIAVVASRSRREAASDMLECSGSKTCITQGISRTALESKDAEVAQPQNCRTEPAMCDLSGDVQNYGDIVPDSLIREEWEGAERRSSRQYPGCPLWCNGEKGSTREY